MKDKTSDNRQKMVEKRKKQIDEVFDGWHTFIFPFITDDDGDFSVSKTKQLAKKLSQNYHVVQKKCDENELSFIENFVLTSILYLKLEINESDMIWISLLTIFDALEKKDNNISTFNVMINDVKERRTYHGKLLKILFDTAELVDDFVSKNNYKECKNHFSEAIKIFLYENNLSIYTNEEYFNQYYGWLNNTIDVMIEYQKYPNNFKVDEGGE